MAVNTFNSEITQISEADRARGEVEALKRHAAAAKANVLGTIPELYHLKISMD